MHSLVSGVTSQDFTFQTEELQMRVQQRTGGDHTPSMLRENSDNGVVQHCSKPRPQQDKKSEQKNSGVDVMSSKMIINSV